jgi:hypothetical protein
MLRAIVIVASLWPALPSSAEEVRVITGATEHSYGHGGRVLDNPELRAKNRQAERQMRNERGQGSAGQQRAVTVQTSRRQTPRSWWNDTPQQPPRSWWSDPQHQNPPKSVYSNQ